MSVISIVLGLLLVAGSSSASDISQLKLLYLGDPDTPRFKDFSAFLQQHAHFEARSRKGFNPAEADPFDVVLLDWPQSESARLDRLKASPLGSRENWRKPTVLLGSAGLNLAVVWKVRGGSG